MRENFATYLFPRGWGQRELQCYYSDNLGILQMKINSQLHGTMTSRWACAEETLVLDKCYREPLEYTSAIRGKQVENVSALTHTDFPN